MVRLKEVELLRLKKRKGLYDKFALSEEEYLEDAGAIIDGTKDKGLIGAMEWFIRNAPSKDYEVIAKSVVKQLKKITI